MIEISRRNFLKITFTTGLSLLLSDNKLKTKPGFSEESEEERYRNHQIEYWESHKNTGPDRFLTICAKDLHPALYQAADQRSSTPSSRDTDIITVYRKPDGGDVGSRLWDIDILLFYIQAYEQNQALVSFSRMANRSARALNQIMLDVLEPRAFDHDRIPRLSTDFIEEVIIVPSSSFGGGAQQQGRCWIYGDYASLDDESRKRKDLAYMVFTHNSIHELWHRDVQGKAKTNPMSGPEGYHKEADLSHLCMGLITQVGLETLSINPADPGYKITPGLLYIMKIVEMGGDNPFGLVVNAAADDGGLHRLIYQYDHAKTSESPGIPDILAGAISEDQVGGLLEDFRKSYWKQYL